VVSKNQTSRAVRPDIVGDPVRLFPENTQKSDGAKREPVKGFAYFQTGEKIEIESQPQTEEVARQPAKPIAAQIIEQVSSMKKEDGYELCIRLKPDSLGIVTVRLMSESGRTTAKLIASNRVTRDLLLGQINGLENALKAQGIEVKTIEVLFSSAMPEYSDQPEQRQNERQEFDFRQEKREPLQAETKEVPERMSSIDYLI
ncbi:MAG TPA: flagellar hook-length control protein FliK, partial [Clostridia bacterium]|nr:flagellar hook-length control protein FliK [Clostridia bacterium]